MIYRDDADRAELHFMDALQFLADMPTATVDMIITDPPYSSGGTFRGDRTSRTSAIKYTGLKAEHFLPDFGGDNRDQRSFGYWSTLWLTQCFRVAKPGAILTVSTDWRQLPTVTDVVQAGGWTWRGILAWAKPNTRPQRGRPTNTCEFVVWATAGARAMDGDTFPGWWLVSSPRPHERHHQTEKPLTVYRDLVGLAPAEGTVLDPFCGSGTTGVAALLEGRKFIGVDMSREYLDIAADRLRSTSMCAPPTQPDLLGDVHP